MGAIFNHACTGYLVTEVGLRIDQSQAEEEQGVETNPPGKGQVEAILGHSDLVDSQEDEKDEHEDGGDNAINTECLSVTITVRAHMIDSHGFARENSRLPIDGINSRRSRIQLFIFLPFVVIQALLVTYGERAFPLFDVVASSTHTCLA